MHKIFIDSRKFSNFQQFLEYMTEILCSSYDGCIDNLDAFADILEGVFGVYAEDEEVKITWKGVEKSKKELGSEETANYLTELLEDCHPSARDEKESK